MEVKYYIYLSVSAILILFALYKVLESVIPNFGRRYRTDEKNVEKNTQRESDPK